MIPLPLPGVIRILVVDDYALVREGVTRVLNIEEDMEVVGDTDDGTQAVRLCEALQPAVALVDVSMPGESGMEVTRRIAERCPEVKVIAFTRHRDVTYVTAMTQAGARGYVLKQSASDELKRAIRSVVSGARYVDSALHVTL